MKAALPLLAAVSALGLQAQQTLPFGFAPPEITLSDFNTHALRVSDINEDGWPDLLVINNEKGSLDLFLQLPPDAPKPPPPPVLQKDRWRPDLADGRFDRQSLLPGNVLWDLCSADFNGDGHPDIAVSTESKEVLVYHGPLRRGWKPDHRVEVKAVQNNFGSLIWDPAVKRLILLGENDLEELAWDAAEKRYTLNSPASPPMNLRPYFMRLADVNADGEADLIYNLRSETFPLGIHLRKQGALDSLQLLRSEPESFVGSVLTEKPLRILGLHPRSGSLQQLSFQNQEADLQSADALELRYLHLDVPRPSQNLRLDLTGDGRDDLIALTPGNPELLLYEGLEKGDFGAAKSFPIPPGISWMLPVELDGKLQLLFHDRKSSFLGLSRWEQERLSFPIALENDQELMLATSVPGKAGELLAVKKDKRKYQLLRVALKVDAEGGSLELLGEEISLPMKRDPGALLPLPLQEGQSQAFLISSAFEEAMFLELKEDASDMLLHESATGSAKALLKGRKEGEFQFFPADAGLPTPWLLLLENSAQFLRYRGGGRVDVVEQLNLESPGRLTGLMPLSADGKELGLLNSSARHVEWHHRGEGGLYSFRKNLTLPAMEFRQAHWEGTGEHAYLRLDGRQQIGFLFPRPPAIKLETETLYDSDLPEVKHEDVFAGDFNGDGKQDILLLDNQQRKVIELLTESEGRWRSVMHFQIFDVSQMGGRQGGDFEPRETLIQDMNRDGLDDVVLLIHDRILLYLQEPLP